MSQVLGDVQKCESRAELAFWQRVFRTTFEDSNITLHFNKHLTVSIYSRHFSCLSKGI